MPTGILLLDKPRGLTSNGALQRVRRAFGAASAGHVGTLDPMATGMLPICLDEATKVIAELEHGAKAYEFTLQLGSRTDTGDAEGQVVESLPVPVLNTEALDAVVAKFTGEVAQVPPMYSALKREGRPLYELARQGVVVERPPRTVNILTLRVQEMGVDSLRLYCECSRGTYIRVMGEDLARALGTVGHLTQLRRPWVEPFREHPMATLEEALAGAAEAHGLMPPDQALRALPEAHLTPEQAASLRQGQAVRCAITPAGKARRVRLYGPAGTFLGLAEPLPDGRLQPRRLLATIDR